MAFGSCKSHLFTSGQWLLALMLAVHPVSPLADVTQRPAHVFIVDSYDPKTFEWTQEIHQGFLQGMAQHGYVEGKQFTLRYTTLNAFLNNSAAKREQVSNAILAEIDEAAPDIVICTDDDAMQWVGLRLGGNTPVLFNGVNGDPKKYITFNKIDSMERPGHHITGVYQTSYFAQGLSLLKQVYPQASRFGVITDATTTGLTLLNSIKNLDQSTLPLHWTRTLLSNEITVWESTLAEWHTQGIVDAVFILTANSLTDEQGVLLDATTATRRITNKSPLPEAGSWETQVKAGLFISATDSSIQQGLLTAQQTVKVLNGEKPGNLPIITPQNGVPVINIKRGKMLNAVIPQTLINTIIETGKVYQ